MIDKKMDEIAEVPNYYSIKNKEEDADLSATQYINSQLKKGIKVNESRIRQQALKEGWTPNKEMAPERTELSQKGSKHISPTSDSMRSEYELKR